MLLSEQIVTFSEAAKALPKLNGKRPHPSTLWRWARKGCRGVKLEVRRLGGRFVTSMEALERFSKELGEVELPDRPAPPPKLPTNRQRLKSIERAKKNLEAVGI